MPLAPPSLLALDRLRRGRPLLHTGAGDTPETLCCMQWVSLLLDQTDVLELDAQPQCANRLVVYATITVNDHLFWIRERQGLWQLVPRLLLAQRMTDPVDEWFVDRRLALWCARSVEHLARPSAITCNDLTERWLQSETFDLPPALREARIVARDDAYVFGVEPRTRCASKAAIEASVDPFAVPHCVAEMVEDPLPWLGELLDVHDKIRIDMDWAPDEKDLRLAREVGEIVEGWG